MKILYVEDEVYMARAVAQVLRKNNYSVDLAYDGETGLELAASGVYDIVILDVMLPKRDGIGVLKEMRGQGVSTPVILLTAKGELEDKVKGLDSGADDYLAKPFQTEELMARLRALGRRKELIVTNDTLVYGDVELNYNALDLSGNDQTFHLTLKESQLLELLILNKGHAIPTDTIIEKLWGWDSDTEDSHVQVQVAFLRKKLSLLSKCVRIKTIRGVGYMLSMEGRETPVFRKLRNSMMLFNMLTVSLVMLAAFSIIYLVTQQNIQRENNQRLQAVSGMFFFPNRTLPDAAAGLENIRPASGERFSVEYGVSFVLFVKDGKLENVNSQLDLADSVYVKAFDMAGTARSGEMTLEGRKWLFRTMEAPRQAGDIPNLPYEFADTRIVFLDVTHSVRIMQSLLMTLGIVGFAVLFALFFISYRFAARAVQPIEENYNKQKQFITDASHEFRTPLAVIGANVDAITASGEETVDSQKEWFGYIRFELKRTGKLVDDMLYLAKSEQVKGEDSLSFDLSAVCETACASMEAVLYESGKTMRTDIAKGISVTADSGKITGVLYILLDNAGKYTPEGGNITVRLSAENEKAVLRVINTGEEIPADDLPRIFDRFYRSDASRSTETGGSGLGLSIAKTIVEHSGGTISAQSGGGITTFTVMLRMTK